LQNRTSDTAADDSGKRIPNRSQTVFFHGRSGNVPADGAAD
jgi:hypothetical protein